MNWLVKEEPTHYSFDDLIRRRITHGIIKRASVFDHLLFDVALDKIQLGWFIEFCYSANCLIESKASGERFHGVTMSLSTPAWLQACTSSGWLARPLQVIVKPSRFS